MNTEKKLGIGFIGTGVTIRTHLPYFKTDERCEVRVISGSSFERAKEVASKSGIPHAAPGYEAICEDPNVDLVIVGSPNVYHVDHVKYALACGKHVLAEKPLGMNALEVESINSVPTSAGQIKCVNHQLRFHPYFQLIRKLVATDLGKVYLVRIHQQSLAFSDLSSVWNWSLSPEDGGGIRLAMGTHFVDLLGFLFPSDAVATISCSLDPVFEARQPFNQTVPRVSTASTSLAAQMVLTSGSTVQLSSTAGALSEPKFQLSIYGTQAELTYSMDTGLKLSRRSSRGNIELLDVPDIYPEEIANKTPIFKSAFRYFGSQLVNHLVGGESAEFISSVSTFDDAAKNMSILDAMLKAALNGDTYAVGAAPLCRATI